MSALRKHRAIYGFSAAGAAAASDGGGAEGTQKQRKGEIRRTEKEAGSAQGNVDCCGSFPCACGACGILLYRRYDRLVARAGESD